MTSEQRAAEERAIEDYKKTLKGKSPPSTVAVFRAAFRAGALWQRTQDEAKKHEAVLKALFEDNEHEAPTAEE